MATIQLPLVTPSCSTCRHWKPLPSAANVRTLDKAGAPGECRAFPPLRNFSFPRTNGEHACGCHEPAEQPRNVAGLRKKYQPRLEE